MVTHRYERLPRVFALAAVIAAVIAALLPAQAKAAETQHLTAGTYSAGQLTNGADVTFEGDVTINVSGGVDKDVRTLSLASGKSGSLTIVGDDVSYFTVKGPLKMAGAPLTITGGRLNVLIFDPTAYVCEEAAYVGDLTQTGGTLNITMNGDFTTDNAFVTGLWAESIAVSDGTFMVDVNVPNAQLVTATHANSGASFGGGYVHNRASSSSGTARGFALGTGLNATLSIVGGEFTAMGYGPYSSGIQIDSSLANLYITDGTVTASGCIHGIYTHGSAEVGGTAVVNATASTDFGTGDAVAGMFVSNGLTMTDLIEVITPQRGSFESGMVVDAKGNPAFAVTLKKGTIDRVTISKPFTKHYREDSHSGQVFDVSVEGTASNKDYTLEVIGATKEGTKAYISTPTQSWQSWEPYNVLNIASGETGDSLTVRATSVADPTKYADWVIKLIDKPYAKAKNINITYDASKLPVLTTDMTGRTATELLSSLITCPTSEADAKNGWYVQLGLYTGAFRWNSNSPGYRDITTEDSNLYAGGNYALGFHVVIKPGYFMPTGPFTINGEDPDAFEEYPGTSMYEYVIALKKIDCKMRMELPKAPDLTYDGTEKTGVEGGGAYSVENGSATDAGSYTAKVTLGDPKTYVWSKDGELIGDATADVPWKISPASIKDAKIDPIPDQEWKGTPVEPKPVVKLGGKTLSEGADYTLTYSGNAKAGTATVTATGKGNYAGTAKATFKIAAPEQLWKRLAGKNALFTMREIVREGFSAKGGAVVIATNASFKDALSAAALAGKHNAPILMTPPDALSAVTASEIKRLAPATAYIVGGELAVSKAVEDAVAAMGATVERVAGRNAADTSVEVAKKVGRSTTAIVATSADFADALSIAPWAYANRAPIILTNGKGQLTQAGLNRIKAMGAKRVVVVGGTAAVSQESEDMVAAAGLEVVRLAGATAVRTSAAVAAWELGEGFSLARVACATRTSYKDALAGSALMGQLKGPIVLVNGTNYSAVRDTLKGRAAQLAQGYFLGGEAAISADVAARIEAIK